MISFLWLTVPLRRVIRFVKSSPWKRTMPDDLLLLLHGALVLSLLPLPTRLQSWHCTGLESWWFLWICHYFLCWRVFVCVCRIALSLGYPEIGDARKLSKTLMQFSTWDDLSAEGSIRPHLQSDNINTYADDTNLTCKSLFSSWKKNEFSCD